MIVRWKRMRPNAKVPTYGTAGAAGLDLYSTGQVTYNSQGCMRFCTGVAVEIPAGYVGLLFPRSSISNTKLRAANAVGVIDSDYRGEITFVCDELQGLRGGYKQGDQICQLVIVPAPGIVLREADELSETARGEGGYGSTGR